jgi:hypothetical protein
MASDEDIQKAWQKIRRLDLAVMKDGTYQLAVTSPSNTKVPNIDLFVDEYYDHSWRDIYLSTNFFPSSKVALMKAFYSEKQMHETRLRNTMW